MDPRILPSLLIEVSEMHRTILAHDRCSWQCSHRWQEATPTEEAVFEKAAYSLSRVILQAYVAELQVMKHSADSSIELFKKGGLLAVAIDDVVEMVFCQVLSAKGARLDMVVELCAAIHTELMGNSRPGGLSRIFKRVLCDTADRVLTDSWDSAHTSWNGLASSTMLRPNEFNTLRNVSAFFGCLHATGILSSEDFDLATEAIVNSYTSGSLELLTVAAVDLIYSGGVTVFDANVGARVDNWHAILKHLEEMEGDDEGFKTAKRQLSALVVEFYDMPPCLGRSALSSRGAPAAKSDEDREFETQLQGLLVWAERRLASS